MLEKAWALKNPGGKVQVLVDVRFWVEVKGPELSSAAPGLVRKEPYNSRTGGKVMGGWEGVKEKSPGFIMIILFACL